MMISVADRAVTRAEKTKRDDRIQRASNRRRLWTLRRIARELVNDLVDGMEMLEDKEETIDSRKGTINLLKRKVEQAEEATLVEPGQIG